MLVPLGEVRLSWEEPHWVELLPEQDVAPKGDAKKGDGDEEDENLDRAKDHKSGDFLEEALENVSLAELVRPEVFVDETDEASVPSRLDPSLVQAEPGNEPGCLEEKKIFTAEYLQR